MSFEVTKSMRDTDIFLKDKSIGSSGNFVGPGTYDLLKIPY